jgi:hypothetical protein
VGLTDCVAPLVRDGQGIEAPWLPSIRSWCSNQRCHKDEKRERKGERVQGVVSAYEVAPDRIILYVWPRAVAEANIRFAFRPRYPIRARTAPSTVYDYYNPDARAVLPPVLFSVE